MTGKPLIVAALGARGTGKSAWTKALVRQLRPRRLAVWDLMREYPDVQATDRLGDFVRQLDAPRFALAFHPSRDERTRLAQFDAWCAAMLAAGRLVAVVEELAFVTSPHRAPPAWREMSLLGRHPPHELSIIGTSQRPASIDKDFLGNADLVHCGRLAYEPDAKRAAQVLGCTPDELMHLPDLAWVERRAGDAEPRRGTLTFDGPTARPIGKRPQGKKLRAG